jgi:hypothetical protein
MNDPPKIKKSSSVARQKDDWEIWFNTIIPHLTFENWIYYEKFALPCWDCQRQNHKARQSEKRGNSWIIKI